MKRAMADKVKAAQKKAGGDDGPRDFGLGGGGKREKGKGQLEREAHFAKIAAEEKAAKEADQAKAAAIAAKGKAAAAAKALGPKKDKTVTELTDDDGPKLVSKVVGKALDIPKSDSILPKAVLDLAMKKLPAGVAAADLAGLAPKAALLVIAAALAEIKAAKAAKIAAKNAAKKAEAQAKQDALDAAAAAKRAERAAALAAKEAEREPEPEDGTSAADAEQVGGARHPVSKLPRALHG